MKTLRTDLLEAVGFWERRRLAFNLLLLLVVVIIAGLGPHLRYIAGLWRGIVALIVIANVGACAVYPVDVLAQQTRWVNGWRRHGRHWMWRVGAITAAAIFGLLILVMFDPAAPLPTPD